MAKDAESLIVLESFVGTVDGEERLFRIGDPVRASDPAVKKWPHLFGPTNFNHPLVEQATAAPGEKRSYRFKSKKVAAKPEPKPEPEPEPEPEPAGKAITLAGLKGE